VEFTSLTKEKLPLKFTTPDLNIQGTKNPCHHVMDFISVMTLKGLDKDIVHIIFP